MTDLLPSHRKLHFPREPGRIAPYASLYRLGDPALPGPAVVYLGGAISLAVYRERSGTEPAPVRLAFEAALAEVPRPRVDLLVCPCPADTRLPGESEPVGPVWMEHHWDEELAPALGAAPTALGLVGYSAGAIHALHLGAVAGAKAVATLGGAGLVRAARTPELARLLSQAGGAGLEVGVYRNAEDGADEPADVVKAIPLEVWARAEPARPGGHAFADYAGNGSARGAFRFVLERLGHAPPPSP